MILFSTWLPEIFKPKFKSQISKDKLFTFCSSKSWFLADLHMSCYRFLNLFSNVTSCLSNLAKMELLNDSTEFSASLFISKAIFQYSFFSHERNENRYQTNWCFKINLLHVFVYYWVFSKVFKTEIMPYTAPEMTVFLFVLGNYTILNNL